MKDIQNKLILITGGSSGIGRIMAFAFAEKKARVIIWDVNSEAVKAAEDEAQGKNLFIKGMICDVSNPGDVCAQAKKLTEDFGHLDILINNAGVVSHKGSDSIPGPLFLSVPDERIRKTIEINTLSLFWTCKAFLPSMIERNSGHIVTISSSAGIIGVKGLSDYSASKFAAFGFDESLRMEFKRMKSAIKTTVVCPFFIDTGMFHGVKTRFPLLLPILKSEYAAKKIVAAVLKNKQQLFMPCFVRSVFFLRILPVQVLDFAANITGISHAMDDFKGRT